MREFGPGDITVATGDDIHRISNESGQDLTTIHVYCPAIEGATLYTPIPTSS